MFHGFVFSGNCFLKLKYYNRSAINWKSEIPVETSQNAAVDMYIQFCAVSFGESINEDTIFR